MTESTSPNLCRTRGKVLVTGGAGYIGSHVVRSLVEIGKDVIVVDNLSTGHAWAVTGPDLVVGDLGDGEALDRLFMDLQSKKQENEGRKIQKSADDRE